MAKKVSKFVYWTPRILGLLFVAFLALFSLDVFGTGLGFWQTLGALFMHNIPALILLAVVIISWKHEIVGGIAFILAGLLYIALMAVSALRGQFEWYMIVWSLQIAGPAFLVGILFLACWRKKKK
ncbi:MAG: hypothetical protein QXM31_02295 [Candidatus Woesearchaeota archaeon]